MSRRRKRICGAIMYAALLAWGLVAIYSGVEFATPRVENWLEQRRILKALRSPDVKTRQGVVLDLEHKSPAFARAHLVEALGDPSIDVRLAACHSLAHHGYEPQSLIPVLAAAADDAGPGRTALPRRSRRAAGRARLPEATPGLIRQLGDSNSDVRRAAPRSNCSRSSSRTPAPRCRTRPMPGD